MNKIFCMSLFFSLSIMYGAEKGTITKSNEYTCLTLPVAHEEDKVSTAFFSGSGKKCATIAHLKNTYLTTLNSEDDAPLKKTTLVSSSDEFGWCGAFNNKEQLLAIARDNDVVELWDTQTGRLMHNILVYELPCENEDCISTLNFGSDQFHFIVGHTNPLLPVKVFDIEKGLAIATYDREKEAGVAAVTIAGNNTIVIGFEKNRSPLMLWDYRQKKICTQLTSNNGILKALTTNDTKIAMGQTQRIDDVVIPTGVNAHLALLDMRTNNQVWTASTFYDAKDFAALPTMGSLALTDDSSALFSTMGCYLNQYAISPDNGATQPVTYQGHTDKITHVITPQKDVVYTIAADKTMRIWNINKQQNVKKRTGRCITM